MHQVTLLVKGMTCGHCVQAIRSRLEELNGVTRVDVRLTTGQATGQATVDFDPEKVSVESLVEAIGDEGYEVSRAAG